MKALLMSLMALALVGGLLGGGLFATFSDTETSTGNTFTAGTMDLQVHQGTGKEWSDGPLDKLWTVECLAPDDPIQEVTVDIRNVGCVDGIADIHFYLVSSHENGFEEPEPIDGDGHDGLGELADSLVVGVAYDGGTLLDLSAYDTNPADGYVTIGELHCQQIDLGALDANTQAFITVALSVLPNTGNEIMGDSCVINVEFTLHQ